MSRILGLLNLEPSAESVDYVERKTQFHLHTLVTEQRHPATWDLSFVVQRDPAAGLRAILAVDDDLERRIAELARDPALLEQAVAAVVAAVRAGRRIYVYGCGATGRLAKLVESALWRPFWRRLESSPSWSKLAPHLPPGVSELVTGEMTGADRALVSSLEGFEDLTLVGKLQLEDHGIERGDVVFCVTEGGETSSVIGTILTARVQYGDLDDAGREDARRHLYFIYNNPDDVLRPFERSRRVLDEAAITRINLATGPQAIAGSTRMQATTIETFVLGVILEEAVARLLGDHLAPEELRALGVAPERGIARRLADFAGIRRAVERSVEAAARVTTIEADTYAQGRFATYYARRSMVTVFTDCTERSPTFRLYPLDRVDAPERLCWVQVWTEGSDAASAWETFLGRRFRGLDPAFYRAPLETQVTDPYLKKAALQSLANAGNDQEQAYDFSFSKNSVARCGPETGDLGVLVLMGDEIDALALPESPPARFMKLFRERGARVAIVWAGTSEQRRAARPVPEGVIDERIDITLEEAGDPLGLRQQIALKILLNAHSSAVMARLGRVIGNTMTNVSPSNLKLIGRATALVLSHVNDTLAQPGWVAAHGPTSPLDFAEANAVVMDAMDYVRSQEMGQTAEVALAIIRILASLDRRAAVRWAEARGILDTEGLAAFLHRHNPALDRGPGADPTR